MGAEGRARVGGASVVRLGLASPRLAGMKGIMGAMCMGVHACSQPAGLHSLGMFILKIRMPASKRK